MTYKFWVIEDADLFLWFLVDPKEVLLGTTLNHESIQEDLILEIIGLEFFKEDVLLCYLRNFPLEWVERG